MKMSNKIYAEPEEIIAPAEAIRDPKKLEEYFNLFLKGQIEHISPALVVRRDISTQERAVYKLARSYGNPYHGKFFGGGEWYEIPQWIGDKVNKQYSDFENKINGAELYLLDGFHRATAATLTQSPIFCYELEDDSDLKKIREMAEKGWYPKLFREEGTLRELRMAFEDFCFNNMSNVGTLRQRVEEMVSRDQLPRKMIRCYRTLGEK